MDLVLRVLSGVALLCLPVAVLLQRYTIKNLLPEYFGQKGKNYATKEDVQELTRLAEKAKNLATKEDIAGITHAMESAKKWHAAEIEEVRSHLAALVSRTLDQERRKRDAGESVYRAGVRYWLAVASATVASPYEPAATRESVARYRDGIRAFHEAAMWTFSVLGESDPVRVAASDMMTTSLRIDAKLNVTHAKSLRLIETREQGVLREQRAREQLAHARAARNPEATDAAYAEILAALDAQALVGSGEEVPEARTTSADIAELAVSLFRIAERLANAPEGSLASGDGKRVLEEAIRGHEPRTSAPV